MSDLRGAGKEAAYLPDADSIVTELGNKAQGGDVVCVFSNGGFGNIHSSCWSDWRGVVDPQPLLPK